LKPGHNTVAVKVVQTGQLSDRFPNRVFLSTHGAFQPACCERDREKYAWMNIKEK